MSLKNNVTANSLGPRSRKEGKKDLSIKAEEIPLSKSRTAMMEIVWLGFALGALYLAIKSLDPFYWQTIHINIEGTTWLMRQLPVAARVGILGSIGLALLWLSFVTMQRLLSDAPALVMDADGIEGYKNNISHAIVRMGWDEIGDITTHYGQMSIYSKRESMLERRKQIVLQTDSVGKSPKDIVAIMQAFMMVSRPSGFTAPQRSYETPLPSSPTAGMARPAVQQPQVQQPQVVVRTSSVMANANKPTFGTRRS